ncbi:PepSY-like domain-containing protein [Maribacter sp. 2210JD10-5]|uniref:PepSY-like domain-containing protein n=1 Tax=Maribacter sp. 2210JD10-5 TaxID=3386272 RepID=UPI0039BD558D
MKNTLRHLIIVFALVIVSCNSKTEGQVPEAVKKTFQSKYPGETDPDWRKDKNGNYESHFKKDGEHYRADFSPNGDWIETECNIKKKELPKAVKAALKASHGDVEIVEIEKVDHVTKGVFYDVEIKIDGEKQDIEFTKEGKRIN